MAKRVYSSSNISGESKVDVFRFRENVREFVGTMTLTEWMNLENEKGWNYRAYQPGFCN